MAGLYVTYGEVRQAYEIQNVPKRCIHIIIWNINLLCIHLFGTLCMGRKTSKEET
jgi:hypothetical protein